MKKLIALLVAAMFSLSAAMPAIAAPADDTLAMVPATKAVKSGVKHKKVKAGAKHKKIKKAKHKRTKKASHAPKRQH